MTSSNYWFPYDISCKKTDLKNGDSVSLYKQEDKYTSEINHSIDLNNNIIYSVLDKEVFWNLDDFDIDLNPINDDIPFITMITRNTSDFGTIYYNRSRHAEKLEKYGIDEGYS